MWSRHTKKCSECNSPNSEKAKFCIKCYKVFCNCRKVSLIGSAYCYYCGQPLAAVSTKNNEILTYNQVLEQVNNYERYRNIKEQRGLIGYFRSDDKKKERELECNHNRIIIEKNLDIFLKVSMDRIYQIVKRIKDEDIYLIYSDKISFIKEVQGIHYSYLKIDKSGIPNISSTAREFSQDSENVLFYIDSFNNEFVRRKKREYADLFINEGVELDDEQKRAVITDDKHNLVVAGAGSGKTEVLITRIAYLIKRKTDTINPERILVLAFQKKAKEEIKQRLKKRYGIDIQTETFHSLGNKILQDNANEKRGSRPTLKDELIGETDRIKYVKKLFDKEIKENIQFKTNLIDLLKVYEDSNAIESQDNLTKTELLEYQRNLRYTTLNGRRVKSESERQIMNYFLSHNLNGENIDIIYEAPATWMKYTNERGQVISPRPDFLFPEFGIYLEHWTITDDKGDVPEWYEGETQAEKNGKYLEGRRKKKDEYEKNNKLLIEITGKDFEEGNIENILKEKFLTALRNINPTTNYEIEPLSYEELANKVWKECREFIEYLPKNLSSFIEIAKTNKLYPEDIEKKLSKPGLTKRQICLGKIALKIYQRYEESLGKYTNTPLQDKYIDFPDMINQASDLLKENPSFYKNKYDHILVDEYQDISMQRYKLISLLMDKNPKAKLFCVGDDWQSIMGFTGSNLDFFIDFEKYFKNHARTELTKNYRSIKSIVDTGSAIIKNNKRYIEKMTASNSESIKPIIVYTFLHPKNERYRYYKEMALHCLTKIKEIKEREKNISYNDFMVLFRTRTNLYYRIGGYANQMGIPLDESGNKDSARLMTVHGSKGLQSKYVFILNVDKDLKGFPCEIEDPSFFNLAKENCTENKLEEERRLFYVALTRAKEGVFLYNQKCSESKFISELKQLENTIVNEVETKVGYTNVESNGRL